jgi:hypothetical protein
MPSKADLESPLWRLRNLYSCRAEGKGTAIPLRLRAEQDTLLTHLVEKPTIPAYVIKSRRLGISTAVDTFQADSAVFNSGWRGLIVDKTQADATKKMVEIVRFAVDSLPQEILSRYEQTKRNDSELRLRLHGEGESNDSVVYATTGGRGGDCSMLHVSEWGPIAALDPTRSNEIRTGIFPAARLGRRVVETTWYGGKAGDLWEMIKPVMEHDPNAEGIVYFFPWHADPAALRIDGMVTEEIEAYFKDLADKLGKSFSPEQKKWYASKKAEQGIFIKREYPSTIEEAFSAPVEGSIYGDIISSLRGAGRIRPFDWNTSCPVFAAWDLGWSDSTSVWLFQTVGLDIHWIWHTRQSKRTAAEMATILRETNIPIAGHFLPHDAAAKDPAGGKSYRDALSDAGLLNLNVVPRTINIWAGINQLRDLLKRSWFRLPFCDLGITALEAYHKKDTQAGGVTAYEPVHDWSSHDSDAARVVAEALAIGLVKGASKRAIDHSPRLPDGSVVELDQIRQIRSRNRGVALSGHSPL